MAFMTKEERFREVKAAMARAGIKNVDIALKEDVTPNYVYLVLSEQRTGYRIRRAIAREVGHPVEYFWPDTPLEYRRAA
jgi:uncharacterized protein YggE